MREIIKRDGQRQLYDPQKIKTALSKAFASCSEPIDPQHLEALLQEVERITKTTSPTFSVEAVQDAAERALMANGHYEVAKNYILYRQRHAECRNARQFIVERTALPDLEPVLTNISRDFPQMEYDLTVLLAKFHQFLTPDSHGAKAMDRLIQAALELTTQDAPRWEFIAARLLNHRFQKELQRKMAEQGIRSFYDKLRYLTDEGLYGEYILARYSRKEIEEAERFLVAERDLLFNYSGLDLLIRRYVIQSKHRVSLETPQEMYLGIALHLAMEEPCERMHWVQKFYDMLSTLKVTMATPTLSNARKPHHQLSSCFIDTVPDSLEGIYRSLDNFAQVSKFGGGMGLYFGKVRSAGSSIRGFEGAAGGVIRWIRLVNDTAVAVDQLGMRQGAVAVYLDAWHKDLPEFLNLRTNNGDDRMKAHDVFPAICYPDLFWKKAKESMDNSWALVDPHEVLTIKGYALEDSWGEEWERRYEEVLKDPRISKRVFTIRELIRLILKSAVETGAPFVFNRDTVNRANPNGHEGIIYCSNLCTEIAQNMSPIETVSRTIESPEGDPIVVTVTRPGDFVVCNLASLTLGRIEVQNPEALKDVVRTAVRALDNVIDLNFYPLAYAQITNKRYRSIGLGVSGYHHMLARHAIPWESEEHLRFADDVFERINQAAIEASSDLAEEKGAYRTLEGSDWQTGKYFKKRGYTSPFWKTLQEKVARQGMRNAYLLAVAPTSSTSIISGTTAGVDPVMNRYFLEEKKGSMLPRVAPDLTHETFWYYQNAHHIDQSWSIKAAGVRQRHIDQAQSLNLYITTDFTMRQVLSLYLEAWQCGVKTLYYVRSRSLEVAECDSCSS